MRSWHRDLLRRYWMHNGFVTVEKRKMSKSLGNTLIVHDLLDQWPGEALRYVLLSAHYRQPLDWSEKVLEQAVTTLDRLYGLLQDHPASAGQEPDPAVIEALEDDLNTPTALAALNGLARRLAQTDSSSEGQPAGRTTSRQRRSHGSVATGPGDWFASERPYRS